jgi:stalled ribosome alternative rescue factor ArfA
MAILKLGMIRFWTCKSGHFTTLKNKERQAKKPHAITSVCKHFIFRPKREKVAGSWRRLHNEELHNFYASPSIIRVIKSRRMR